MMDLVVNSLVVLVLSIACALLLPGIQRKIQARLQQRRGPSILSPGLWNIVKASFKENITPNSPSPCGYHIFLAVSFTSVVFMLLFSTPAWWTTVLGSFFAVVGLLKVTELMYLFMGSFSKSVMSCGLPFPDKIRGSVRMDSIRQYFEGHSAVRALKMVTLGSFPFYIALLIPFVAAGSIDFRDIIAYQETIPFIATPIGIAAAVLYFIGYTIVTNTRPFDIIKPKVDVIEGPIMEYASRWRALYYLGNSLLVFALASIFVTAFIGVPFDPTMPSVLATHLVLCLLLPMLSSILSIYSPVFTFKQIYGVSTTLSLIGLVLLILTMAGA